MDTKRKVIIDCDPGIDDMFAGYDMPMLNQLVRATEVHGSGGIGDIEIREPEKKLEKEHGADFLIRTFMENDDISLITLGPLTNVAQAILKEPELKKRIPEILCMGGSATSGNATPAAEYLSRGSPLKWQG